MPYKKLFVKIGYKNFIFSNKKAKIIIVIRYLELLKT